VRFMESTAPTNWSRVVRNALAAGISGGIVIEVYVYLTTILPAHGSVINALLWITSAAFGKAAFSNANYAWLGLLVHFCVSIGWAGGYSYFAERQPFVNQRWLVSGLAYGFVVYIFMVLIQMGAQVFRVPDAAGLLNSVIAHMLFFGVPVAYVVSRLDRA
jgi:uncharacterized membrane protein YagU involved in acid resistance